MSRAIWLGALIALAMLAAAPIYGIDNATQPAGGTPYSNTYTPKPYVAPDAAPKNVDKDIEARRAELAAWETKLKTDEERMGAMRRDLDEEIDRYTKLLMKIEAALQTAGEANDKNSKKIVKSYEAMQPEEAAVRLAALPENLAVNILLGMNPRKSGTALAAMPPPKVASLTQRMASVLKNLPAAAEALQNKKPGTP